MIWSELTALLVGAVLALIVQAWVQLYVVPRVETRKRREERWEHNVADLGELLSTHVGQLAREAYFAQSSFRFLQLLEDSSGVDHDKLAQQRRDVASDAYRKTELFHDLVNTRVEWLVNRIKSCGRETKIIRQFDFAAIDYRIKATSVYVSDDDKRENEAFENEWNKERNARRTLLKKVQGLADLPHPPRKPVIPLGFKEIKRLLKRRGKMTQTEQSLPKVDADKGDAG